MKGYNNHPQCPPKFAVLSAEGAVGASACVLVHLACNSGRIEIVERRHGQFVEGEKTMSSKFSTDVQTTVGPLLERLFFVLDGIDDPLMKGGDDST